MHIHNNAIECLKAGGLALGGGIRMARTVEIAKAMKTAGYDWLFIDLEHSAMPLDIASQISIAALDAGIAPIVRVPRGEYSLATRALDNGAQGIIIPHVESAEEAEAIVSALRLPPKGHRSYSGMNAQLDFKVGNRVEATRATEASTLVVVMLESPEAIAAMDEIAAVDGIDVLMIGTNDLCTEMGIVAQYDHPEIVAAYEKLVDTCKRHGKHAGMGGVDDELAANYIAMGVTFILCGTDLGFMIQSARARSEFLRTPAA